MKNTIIKILLLACYQGIAQYTVPVEQFYNYDYTNINNHYFKDVNNVLNKFTGNWKYQSVNDLVEITIYKQEGRDSGGGYLCDELYIEFRYTNNGTVLFDTFGTNRSYWISGRYFKNPLNTNKYQLRYQEPGQDRQSLPQYLDIEYIPNTSGGQPQLSWSIYTELYVINGEDAPDLPLNMIFTKQP